MPLGKVSISIIDEIVAHIGNASLVETNYNSDFRTSLKCSYLSQDSRTAGTAAVLVISHMMIIGHEAVDNVKYYTCVLNTDAHMYLYLSDVSLRDVGDHGLPKCSVLCCSE